MESTNSKNPSKVKKTIIIAISGVFIIYGLSWISIAIFVDGWSDRGTFGDMFGAVNALFSGLAFAGIIVTLVLQIQELGHQREELMLTRVELKGQKDQLSLQNKAMIHQNFDNTFFQLLRLHNEIVNAINISKTSIEQAGAAHRNVTNIISSGRNCFEIFYSEMKADNSPQHEEYFESEQAKLGHYFRNLYHIIKFVSNSDVENKEFYTSLIRAQLSTYELLLLFYSCVSKYGLEKFKPLVEEYAFFKNMPRNELIKSTDEHFYESTAFGGNS